MGISKKRVEKLVEEILNNPDENDWCTLPETLTTQEREAVKDRILEMGMTGKLQSRLEGTVEAFGFISEIEEIVIRDELEEIEKLKLILNSDHM